MKTLLIATLMAGTANAGELPNAGKYPLHAYPGATADSWFMEQAYWDFVHAQQYGRLPCGYWDKENDRLIDPNSPEGRERFLRGEKCYALDYD